MFKISKLLKVELRKNVLAFKTFIKSQYYPHSRFLHINKWNFYSESQVARKMAC